MANFNKVFLIGNLTRDPELRYTPQGNAVVNLRIATNYRFKDKSGQQKTETCFVTVVVWNKQAELCNQYLRKGKAVFVEGRLQSRTFENSSGQKKNVLEVRAERVQFLSTPLDEQIKESFPQIEEETTEQEWLQDNNLESDEN